MSAHEAEPSLSSFLSSLINVILKILVIVIVLATVGIEMTSIIAIFRSSLPRYRYSIIRNITKFCRWCILLFKPKVGNFIETQSSYSGTIQEIFIFTTRMKAVDKKIVYLPNGPLSNGALTNYNQEGKRRIDCTIGISYGDNVEKAHSVLIT